MLHSIMGKLMNDEIVVERTTENPVIGMVRRASWGSIFAGLFVTLIVQVILTLLGVAIGAATIEPLSQRNPAEGLGTATAIWLVVSGLIALFTGAWVAGRLSGGPRRMDGLLHGVVTFSVAEVAMLLLLSSGLGAIIGGAGSLVTQTMHTGAGQHIANRVEQMMPQGGSSLPDSQPQAVTPQQEQQLRQAGDKVATGVSKGAFWAFIGLDLGLGVAAWGGWAGTASLPRYDQHAVVTEATPAG